MRFIGSERVVSNAGGLDEKEERATPPRARIYRVIAVVTHRKETRKGRLFFLPYGGRNYTAAARTELAFKGWCFMHLQFSL
jgi:hypothetical protein